MMNRKTKPMADERQAGKSPEFTPQDEIDELFARANANPTRVGCPGRDILVGLAHKTRPISDPAYEHLAKCSACYREFRAFQQAATTHPMSFRKAAWVAAAAALVIVVAGAVWFLIPLLGEHGTLPQRSVPESQVAEGRVEVDLRKYSVTRNEQLKPETGPVSLARARSDLTILLPVGSEPGGYEIQVLDSGLRSQASASGEAAIRDYVTTLQTTIDLRALSSGAFQLALRRHGEDWRLFPAEVK
jgi:hypothetical protein